MYRIEIIEDGIIEKGLYCRLLEIEYSDQSDYLRTHSEYSGKVMNNMKWLPVEKMLGDFWMGKTIYEFEIGNKIKYEWTRGNIQSSHIIK